MIRFEEPRPFLAHIWPFRKWWERRMLKKLLEQAKRDTDRYRGKPPHEVDA